MTTNVIGPISKDVWVTMRQLHESVGYMKADNDNTKDWSNAIDRESKLYRDYLGDVKQASREAKRTAA
jgi:hypothetical protein